MPVMIGEALGGWETFFIGISVACVAFWVWMIVDCAIHETSTRAKFAWLLVIALGWVIGAPLYFFVRKLPRQFSAMSGNFQRVSEMTMPPKS